MDSEPAMVRISIGGIRGFGGLKPDGMAGKACGCALYRTLMKGCTDPFALKRKGCRCVASGIERGQDGFHLVELFFIKQTRQKDNASLRIYNDVPRHA